MSVQSISHYELVKQRLSIFSPLSCNHPDSISRRGHVIIIRHRLGQVWGETFIADQKRIWRELIAHEIPEAAILQVTIDRANVRVYISFPNPSTEGKGGNDE